MSEVEADTYIEPRYRATPEAERLLEPEPIDRPIPASDRDSIYENPYSTHIYHNYGGSRISFRSSSNAQTRNRKWSLLCLIVGLVIGLAIGASVTGLSMHFTKTPVCATLPTASPSEYGESKKSFSMSYNL